MIVNELCQRISDMVAIHFLNGIGHLKPAFVRVELASNVTAQGPHLTVGSIHCKLSIQSFDTENPICPVPSTDGQYCRPYAPLSRNSKPPLSSQRPDTKPFGNLLGRHLCMPLIAHQSAACELVANGDNLGDALLLSNLSGDVNK
jgi:hypothetical protein